jgi:hypothetical protein
MDSKKKETYKRPTIEILEMEMDGNICAVGGGSPPNTRSNNGTSYNAAPEPEGYNTRD